MIFSFEPSKTPCLPAFSSGRKTAYAAVVVAGLFGCAFALLMPPFQFNDEHGHFARAYQISRGEFIGHLPPRLPARVLSTLLEDPEGLERKTAPRTSFAALFAGGAGDTSAPELIANSSKLRYLSWGNFAYQVNWPVCYLPASIGIRVARFFDLSPLGMLFAARLMNVLFFLAALATALFLAPSFRALFIAVALMPMTL